MRETDEICVQIEGLTKTTIIKKNKKTEIAKIRSRVKWTEQEGKSTRNFFIVERKRGQEKLWHTIKMSDGSYKYVIDSIMNEQVDFFSKLCQLEGWDENSAHELKRYIVNKLDNDEKKA